MSELHKYPRTPHIEGSGLSTGDHDLAQVPLAALAGRRLVIAEKLDGANAAVSFGPGGALALQSRGHFLTGGPRERHFAPLKAWATRHRDALWRRLGARYVMYGEWMFAKHTIFYDALPHLFLEFDVLDRDTGRFLSTPARHALLAGVPVVSVPVVHEGPVASPAELVAASAFKTAGWRERLDAVAAERGLDVARVRAETDPTDLAEGLYLKTEDETGVTGRFKWVRGGFVATVAASGSHWLQRPIVPNLVRDGVDIYAA